MRLDVHETVNVVVRTWPGASHVLRRHGLDDFLGWAGTPLDEACRAHGIDVELITAEILRQVDPDVAHAFRVSPRAQRPVAPAAPVAEPEAVAAPQPPAPIDDGIPDVASVFRVRAGSPEAPFLHAHRPAPAAPPEPNPEEPIAEEPIAEEPIAEEPAAEDLHPDTQALLARREELRQQLDLLIALRDEALGQARAASAPAQEEVEEEVVAELVRVPEPDLTDPALVTEEPTATVSTTATVSAGSELPPGEEGGLLSRMRSWFAA